MGLDDAPPENLPTRILAAERLTALIAQTLQGGERLLIGADSPFGYSQGVSRALTGWRSGPSRGPPPVVLAEVFPTLIDPAVRVVAGHGAIRDAVQVKLL